MDFSRKQGSQQMDKSPQNFSKSPKASSSFRDRTQEVYKTSQSDRNQPNRSRSSKWKFRFRKGELVPDSDIGPENSRMTLYDFQEFFMSVLVNFFSRTQNIVFIFLMLVNLTMEAAHFYLGVSNFFIVGCLMASLLTQASLQLYFFLQVRKMEENWNQCKIQKLKKGKTKMSTVQISDLHIGDLVFVRSSVICPVDILVVASSDSRHGQNVFHTNERRLDGQNIFYTKNSVRNITSGSKTKSLKLAKSFEKIKKRLSGSVEYDAPHEGLDFEGFFKLDNDPKRSTFTGKNVLFAGTQLCSSWVIGLVIYNGRSTKILQRYKRNIGNEKMIDTRSSRVGRITNGIGVFMMLVLTLQALLSFVIVSSDVQKSKKFVILNNIFESLQAAHLVDLIVSYCYAFPLFMFTVLDVCNFFFGYQIEGRFLKKAKIGKPNFGAYSGTSQESKGTQGSGMKSSGQDLSRRQAQYYQGSPSRKNRPKFKSVDSRREGRKNDRRLKHANERDHPERVDQLQLSPVVARIDASEIKPPSLNNYSEGSFVPSSKDKRDKNDKNLVVSPINHLRVPRNMDSPKKSNQLDNSQNDLFSLQRDLRKKLSKVPTLKSVDMEAGNSDGITLSRGTSGATTTFKRRGLRRRTSLGGTRTNTRDFMFGFSDKKKVKVINFGSLSNLGNIGHIVFDKTDTLTKASVEILRIATVKRNYEIDSETVRADFKDVQKEPEKYRKREVEEEELDLVAVEKYSEKSQEFYRELEGEFVAEVFDEDSSLIEHFRTAGLQIDSKNSSGLGISSESEHLKDKYQDSKGFLTTGNPSQANKKKRFLDSSQGSFLSGRTSQNYEKMMSDSFMNLSKLERRVREKFRQSGYMSSKKPFRRSQRRNKSQKRTIIVVSGSHGAPAFELMGPTLKIDPSKKYTQKNFLVDFHDKEQHIMDVIHCLKLCHEAKVLSSGSRGLKSYHNEEIAILSLCRKIGIEIEPTRQEEQDHVQVYRFSFKSKFQEEIEVLGVNSFSKSRGRMSVLIHKTNSKRYVLYVKGSDSAMRKVTNLTAKDKIVFKQIVMNNKMAGLKSVVFAKKTLTEHDYQSFITNYRLVSQMSRNQEENFEKLAVEIETGLSFVGVLGVRNIIEEEVKALTKNLLKAEFKLSMLTGDSLENTIIAAKELHLSDGDFSDASRFYSMRFRTEMEAHSQIRRILEYLYQKLKILSIYEGKLSNSSSSSQRPSKNTSLRNIQRRRRSGTHLASRSFIGSIRLNKTSKDPKSERRQLQKTLLTDGKSISIIMSSEELTAHLIFILSFCGNMIGHSLEAKHKAFLIQSLRKSSQKLVMAVGDGFNDMAMLKEANIGVQLSHKDVPLIFGDIVVSRLSSLNYLLFVKGKQMFMNYTIFSLLIVITCPTLALILFLCNSETLYSGRPLQPWHAVFIHTWLMSNLVVICISNRALPDSLLGAFPEFYLERRRFAQNAMTIYAVCVVMTIFEAGLIYGVNILVISRFVGAKGYAGSLNLISMNILLPFVVSTSLKIEFFKSRVSRWYYVVNAAVVLSFVCFILLRNETAYKFLYYIPISEFLERSDTYLAATLTIGVNSLLNWCFINYLNKEFLHPMFYEACKQAQLKNYAFFREGGLFQPRFFVPEAKEEDLRLKIKHIFKRGIQMDDGVKKILMLDHSSYAIGMDQVTCRILDNAENKRFLIFRRGWEYAAYRRNLGVFLGTTVAEFVVMVYLAESRNFELDTKFPYVILFFLVPLVCSFFEESQKRTEVAVKTAVVLSFICVIVIQFLMDGQAYVSWIFNLTRLLQGPAHIDYIFGSVSIVVVYLIQLMQILTQPSFNGFILGFIFRVRMAISLLLVTVAAIVFKQKIESMIKLDFLAKLRIKNEVSSSDEKLSMLMPDFILKRMNNFEMSRTFLADDAGEVTILFCDICKFDEVMKQSSANIVPILDDVYRYFDFLCKQHGVQKIETVGKTYMACGGLKFLEEKLGDDVKTSSPTKRAVDVAIGMMEFIDGFTYGTGRRLNLKIGIHYGNCIFGVLGYHKPQFSLIGDTVNTTSRCCTTGIDGDIVLSEQAYQVLKKHNEEGVYKFKPRMAHMKGKGEKMTYIVLRKKDGLKMGKRISVSPNLFINNHKIIRKLKEAENDSEKAFSIKNLDMSNVNEILDKDEDQFDNEMMNKSFSNEDPENRGEGDEEAVSGEDNFLSDFGSMFEGSSDEESQEEEGVGEPPAERRKTDESIGRKGHKRKSFLFDTVDNLGRGSRLACTTVISNLLGNPFKKGNPNFERYFMKRMMLKNQSRIELSLLILFVDSLNYIVTNLLDADLSGYFWTTDALEIAIMISIILLMALANASIMKNNPFFSKIYLFLILVLRSVARVVSIISVCLDTQSTLIREKTHISTVLCFLLESSIANICGLFYLREIFWYNVLNGLVSILCFFVFMTESYAYKVVIVINIAIYNVIDSYSSFATELSSVVNLVAIEKKGLQMTQFVDRLLPRHIQETINRPGQKIGDCYENVTLLYADIVGFTDFSNKNSPRQVVEMLSSLFTNFDQECNRLSLFKIYTIGDCYVVMSFLDKNNRREPKEEANAVTQMGISMIRIINRVRSQLGINLNMRIGIHTGDVYGGVIGTDIVRFDLYGADVFIANKMESKGTPGKINVSEPTKQLLESLDTSNYSFEENKVVELNSIGVSVKCYFLNYEMFDK